MTTAGVWAITVADGSYTTTTTQQAMVEVRYDHRGRASAVQYGRSRGWDTGCCVGRAN